MSNSAKIRRMLAKGLDAKEIAKRLKVTTNLVHQIKYAQKKAKNLTPVRNSESRKAVLKRTMNRPLSVAMAVQEIDSDLNGRGVPQPKKLIVKPVDFNSAFSLMRERVAQQDKDWLERDSVNSPPHYTTGGIETIAFIEAKDLNYRLGNVVKYVSRAEKKNNPLEDLKKAKWYLEREIATRERA